MEILLKLAGILPRLKTKIQLTGLVVVVGAVVAVEAYAPDELNAQIAAGSIGVLFLVFGQVFHFLHLIPEQQRTRYILFMFFGFLTFVILLVALIAIILFPNEEKIDEISFSAKNKSNVAFFDGKTTFVMVNNMQKYSFDDGITIESWIKVKSLYQDMYFPIVDMLWRLEITSSGITFSPGATRPADCAYKIEMNKWNHIAFSYNPHIQKAQYCINGYCYEQIEYNEKLQKGTNHTKGWRKNTNDNVLYIGRGPTGGDEYANGYISEVRLWNKPLAKEAIIKNINEQIKGDKDGLIGCWSFDQSSGPVVNDSSQYKNNGTVHGSIKWVKADLTIDNAKSQ